MAQRAHLLLKTLLTGLTVLYSIPVSAWLLFRAWQGETWPMVGMMNAAGILWFLPLLVLLPLALLLRSRQASVMGGLLLLAALWLFGGDFTPALARAAPAGPQVRVLSFNTLIANQNFDQTLALIAETQPDLIAIQELSPEMAATISDAFGAQYPYQLLSPWPDPRGIGIWSRYPFIQQDQLELELWEGWAQVVLVEVEGTPLYFVNTHLWPIGTLDTDLFGTALAKQHIQAAQLRDMALAWDAAVLMVGDFNASPTNTTYGLLDQSLDDVWRITGSGPGFTWPAPDSALPVVGPFLRIDYMWQRGPITPLQLQVIHDVPGSDHMPLLGEFILSVEAVER